MASCAIEDCGRPECDVCSVNTRYPPPQPCGKELKGGRRCQVAGPHRECRPGRKPNEKDDGSDELQRLDLNNSERDGEADLIDLKGHDPTFEPRKRVGPHR